MPPWNPGCVQDGATGAGQGWRLPGSSQSSALGIVCAGVGAARSTHGKPGCRGLAVTVLPWIWCQDFPLCSVEIGFGTVAFPVQNQLWNLAALINHLC